MKRSIRVVIFTILLTLLMCSATFASDNNKITELDIVAGLQFCKEFPVALNVNGEHIKTDVEPVIIKERTLIPARAVFESMGGTVTWNNDSRETEVSLGTSNVKLWIDSKTAFLNGAEETLDVPAMIIDDRTMIPVRFVAESLDCEVDWNDSTRTVLISSPKNTGPTSISDIKVEDLEDKYRIEIKGEGLIGAYSTFAYDSPERFGIDLKQARLTLEGGNADIDNEIFSNIRYSQFDNEITRVVIDLKEKVAGKVSMSEDRTSLYVDFTKGQANNHESLGNTTIDGLDVLDWRATGKLIIIDPGHGGKDPGSQGKINGKVVLNEKDINLDIALRLNEMLTAAGANTYMLREGDSPISLYGRPELANAANGDLYISVHNNSADGVPAANGTETYYYCKTNEMDYGIDTRRLAQVIQKELIAALGTKDRGAKHEPAYAVLNKTLMPAIIIEGGFISNPDNLNYMLTDEFRQRYAYGAAKGIIQILNESVNN